MTFWRFITPEPALYTEVNGHYNHFILFLSLLVSTLAAYSLIVVLKRMWQTELLSTRRQWKRFGSVTFGLGVWAMHFTGMLAFMLPIGMSFDVALTMVSILPPIVGAYIAAKLIATQVFTFANIQLSSLSLAIGIGAMHYTGMEAMETEAAMTYDFGFFLLSILCAWLFAMVAIYMVIYIQRKNIRGQLGLVGCAMVMGMAIAGMHYVAMYAVHYYLPVTFIPSETGGHAEPAILALAITTLVFVIFATTLLGSIFDKRLQAAELTAKVSAAREKDIVENLADGLLVVNENGRITGVNTVGLSLFGYKDADQLRNEDITKILPGFDIRLLTGDGEEGKQQHVMQLDGKRSDGTTFHCEMNFSPMTVVVQNMHLFNVVIRDITQRLMLEDQLRQAQKMESIGQLAAGIAHEINTPTQYVSDNIFFLKGASETGISVMKTVHALLNSKDEAEQALIRAELEALMKGEDIEFLIDEMPVAFDQSVEGLQRIAKIVGAMKSFSHSGDEKMHKVDLKEAISSTITVARGEWRYVADLEAEFSEDVPLVTCSRDEVNQVVLNFIVNAAHAVEEKFGRERMEKGLIQVRVYPLDDTVIIEITDNGTGMSKEVCKRIFEPFFTTKPPGKGTGQGLSLAYAVIIEKHKGQILVNSEIGLGTTFKIVLPVEHPQTVESELSDENTLC
ncbi:MAG: histidine kinase [Alteromonadaceae bacterium]|nr:histidine kinase [Alteromonadaceae bacterium]